ncbi:MAG: DUF1588 domain-containing protein [Planctomycetaceae bacterium]
MEPDIRGAQSIREQLAKHTSTESCNACHRHIDPGFALENFDPAGQWRERYGSRAKRAFRSIPAINLPMAGNSRTYTNFEHGRWNVLKPLPGMWPIIY